MVPNSRILPPLELSASFVSPLKKLLFLNLSPTPFQSSELMTDNPLCFEKSMVHTKKKKNSQDYMERSPSPPKIRP